MDTPLLCYDGLAQQDGELERLQRERKIFNPSPSAWEWQRSLIAVLLILGMIAILAIFIRYRNNRKALQSQKAITPLAVQTQTQTPPLAPLPTLNALWM